MSIRSTSDGRPGGPSLLFRRAGIDDYSTIRHVQSSAIRSLGDNLLDQSDIANATKFVYTAEYIGELFRKSVHVAVLNGDIVATCAWSPNDDSGTAARSSGLFVAPLFQNSGIGQKLLDDVISDGKSNGYDRFMATVPVSVVPLFSALGFVVASYGTSREIVPTVLLQVAFLRKP